MERENHLLWGFTKEFSLRVEAPACLGRFTQEDASCRDAFLAQGESGSYEEGNQVSFSFLVDRKGFVSDAVFCAFGDPLLVGCAEIICEKSVRKPYQASRSLTAEELMKMAFSCDAPKSSQAKRIISIVLEARDNVCDSLSLSLPGEEEQIPFPEWDSLSKEKRLEAIRETVEKYILPHLKRDGGGLDVVDLDDENRVKVVFQGACALCFASSGSTLSYIQHLLRQKLHPSLCVEPTLQGA